MDSSHQQRKLTTADTHKVYNNILLAMVTYPLAVTTITSKEFLSLQKDIDKTSMTKMKINRHFPKAVW